MLYVEVILPLPLEGVFTYSVPDIMAEKVKMGVRVLVPLGKSKTYTAMAVRTHSQKPDFQTRDILQVIDAEPVLLEKQLKLWQWIATYYMAPLGDVFKAALPAGLKAEENYKPRTVRCVTLAENLRTEPSMQLAMCISRIGTKRTARRRHNTSKRLRATNCLTQHTPRTPCSDSLSTVAF